MVLCIFTIVNSKKGPITDSASFSASSCPLAIVIVPHGLLTVTQHNKLFYKNLYLYNEFIITF